MILQSTLPRISITPELLATLDTNEQLGPLIVDDLADGYTLRELVAPAIGWVTDDDGASVIYSPDGAHAIAVRRNGQVRAFGFATDAAIKTLRDVQACYLAAALARDIEREPFLV